MVFRTFPVAGSFTVRLARLISSLSPTFNPVLLPTFRISVFPLTSATRPDTSTLRVGRLAAEVSSWVAVVVTAWITASPIMVSAKLLLLISKKPPPPPPLPPPAPSSEVPERLDSPSPVTAARISPVVVSTSLAVMPHTALACFTFAPPSPKGPLPKPTPPTEVLLSSRPNFVMEPTIIASTPRMRPILAAVDASARSLLEKFCSARILSSALRSITEYLPLCTSRCTSMSEMPLPTSWSVPKIAATLACTVP